jgi:hypothetical protein
MIRLMQELDESDASGSSMLEYASAREHRLWGPILFRPSPAALVMLAITTAGATWLALRHDPWREVARLPSSYYQGAPFTADGRLLTLDAERGANLWNPADGSLVRNVLPTLDLGTYQYFIIKGGSQILALPHNEKLAKFYNVETGRVIRTAPNPLAFGFRRAAIYPDGSRMISYGIPSLSAGRPVTAPATAPASPFMGRNYLWDLIGPDTQWPPKPLMELPSAGATTMSLSPNGSRLLVPGGLHGFVLIDSVTLKVIASAQGQGGAGWCEFVNDEMFYIDGRLPGSAPAGLWEIIELRSALDGKVIRTVPLVSPAGLPGGPDKLIVSADVRHAVGIHGSGRNRTGRSGYLWGALLQIWNVETGKLLQTRDAVWAPLTFFPDSRRHLTADPITGRAAVYSATHTSPLAILPGAGAGAGASPVGPFIGPDGLTIALPGDEDAQTLTLFRPAGWDCPESHVGALAFPHIWLTIFSLAGAFSLLHRDARLRGRAVKGRIGPLPMLQLVTVLPLCTYALLCVCLGQPRQALWFAPTALLVIASIGLALGSRFWRLANLCLLAASLPYVLWLAHRLYKAGPRSWTLYPLLDRHYEIPHLPVLIGLGCVAALLGLCILTLARQPAE